MLEYSIRVKYDPLTHKAVYSADIEEIRRLQIAEFSAALSVIFGASFEILCKYKGLPKRTAFDSLVSYAGLEDLRKRSIRKGGDVK